VPQLLRLQNFMVSADGYGSGEGQSFEHPFGHANPAELFAWAGATASWPNRTGPGGTRGIDDYLVKDFHNNIGAEIMGRNKFSPLRGPWKDDEWKGWWGDDPPFHTPVFVLTHHHRPTFSLSDTTFTFVEASPVRALDMAKDAAEGRDVRLGGGVATVREFLEADLVDTMHIAISPIKLERGERLWNGPDELKDRFNLESVSSPSGVTHLLFWHKRL
jgi:dihydrofolate reductase